MAAAAAVARGAPLAIPRASGSRAAPPAPLLPRRQALTRPVAAAASAIAAAKAAAAAPAGAATPVPLARARGAGAAARTRVRPQAAAGGAGESGSASDGGEDKNLAALGFAKLALMFAGWYLANIYFNIYNKQLLKVFPHPLTVTNVQFLIGSLLSLAFWAAGAVPKPPSLSRAALAGIWPLAIIHVLGNVLTNVSLGAVAVSFTHTVKAMEPFFSVLMSAIFLGDVPPLPVLLTLVPIVGGVLMASLTEVTFNWTGFLSALFSNITFQSRNVLSKKLMLSERGSKMNNMALFQTITVLSFFMLLPVTLLVEGAPLLPSALAAAGISGAELSTLATRLFLAGLCFHGYQQLSYSILSRVTPVTHSIGNCVKRVVVIVASVVAFSHPMSQQNMIGTGVALGGVFLYSQAKRKYKGSLWKRGGGGDGGSGGAAPAAA